MTTLFCNTYFLPRQLFSVIHDTDSVFIYNCQKNILFIASSWSSHGKRKGDASPPFISPEREGLYKIGGSRRARPVAMEEREVERLLAVSGLTDTEAWSLQGKLEETREKDGSFS